MTMQDLIPGMILEREVAITLEDYIIVYATLHTASAKPITLAQTLYIGVKKSRNMYNNLSRI